MKADHRFQTVRRISCAVFSRALFITNHCALQVAVMTRPETGAPAHVAFARTGIGETEASAFHRKRKLAHFALFSPPPPR